MLAPSPTVPRLPLLLILAFAGPALAEPVAGTGAVVLERPGGRVALDRRPVSGGEYSVCVDRGACARPSYDAYNREAEYRDQPAMSITWYMAQAYCASQGKRLPTLDEYQQAWPQLSWPGCCSRNAAPREWVADEPTPGKATQIRIRRKRGQLDGLQLLRTNKKVGYDSSSLRCAVDLDVAAPSSAPAAAASAP